MKLKIVFFGASLAGKSTTVRKLYEILKGKGLAKGDFLSIETDENRTLFVEMFLSKIPIEGEELDVKILTTPGQFRLHPLRKAILQGVDGLVFTVDSQKGREEINFLVLREMAHVLKELGYDLYSIPVIVQYNKRDLPNALPIEELQFVCNPWDAPYTETIATQGKGVLETFRLIVGKVLKSHVEGRSNR
ncbi:MAG: gliding motility protein [Aquifex sp.]|nr:MAG: gliding motility protein [Aquifex sp.]